MDNSGIEREKSLVYLRDKIIEFFKGHDYVEGSYNDNRFVEYCHKAYMECRDEDVFDLRDLDVLLWADSYQQAYRYLKMPNQYIRFHVCKTHPRLLAQHPFLP